MTSSQFFFLKQVYHFFSRIRVRDTDRIYIISVERAEDMWILKGNSADGREGQRHEMHFYAQLFKHRTLVDMTTGHI